jgi:very-short-patch-repair endonuclease
VSAAEHHGLDVPGSVALHVAVPANAPRVRAMVRGATLVDEVGAVVVHWCEAVSMRMLHRPQEIVEAVLSAASCLPDDWFVALIDSGISRRGHRDPIVGPSLMDELTESLDRHHRDLLAFCDSLSESCIESLVRFRLRLQGICVRSQLVVVEGFRVDFVLDRNIVIEVDGSRFHSGPAAFEADRVRDATLNALGYRVLRFSYRQVVDDWPSVLATILEVRDQERAARRRLS